MADQVLTVSLMTFFGSGVFAVAVHGLAQLIFWAAFKDDYKRLKQNDHGKFAWFINSGWGRMVFWTDRKACDQVPLSKGANVFRWCVGVFIGTSMRVAFVAGVVSFVTAVFTKGDWAAWLA